MGHAEIDYTNAVKYVDEYFDVEYKIIDDFGESMDRAVNLFRDYTSIKNEAKVDFSILGLLIDVAAIALPQVKAIKASLKFLDGQVKGVVDYTLWQEGTRETAKALLGKGYEKGEEFARGQLKELVSGGVKAGEETSLALFAAKHQEDAGKLGRLITELHVIRASVMKNAVEYAQTVKANEGKLTEMFHKLLGPKPVYKSEDISKFESKFELDLYKSYYQRRAYILRKTTDHGYNQKLTETTIEGMPNAVQSRLLTLTKLPNIAFAVMTWNLRQETKTERMPWASTKY